VIQAGVIGKATLLLALGANRKHVERGDKSALAYVIECNHLPMLAWLLEQGFDNRVRTLMTSTKRCGRSALVSGITSRHSI
jgi:hypothetical protein